MLVPYSLVEHRMSSSDARGLQCPDECRKACAFVSDSSQAVDTNPLAIHDGGPLMSFLVIIKISMADVA